MKQDAKPAAAEQKPNIVFILTDTADACQSIPAADTSHRSPLPHQRRLALTMNFTKQPLLPNPRGQRNLRWIRDLLFLTGVVALSYLGFTLLEAKLYQATAKQTLVAETHRQQTPTLSKPKAALHKGDVLGRIDIPRLGLSVAVLEGTSSQVLRLGAGHIEGTPLPGQPGNSGVAGHRETLSGA